MRYWLAVFSPETWDAFREHGGRIAGLPKRAQRSAEQLAIDDVLVAYVTRYSCWVGAARVTGPYTIDRRLLFDAHRDRFVIRLPVEPLVMLSIQSGLPIQGVWNKLNRTRSITPGITGWTYKARLNQAVAPMDDSDGTFLVSALAEIMGATESRTDP